MRTTQLGAAIALLLAIVAASAPADAQTPLTTVRVVSGLDRPLYVTSPPGDLDRIFIVGQRGVIQIVEDGALLGTPFLDIDDRVHPVSLFNNERGLLGLAFHPDYATNGFFYVNYTDNDGNTVVSRFSVTADPNVADPASESVLLAVNQPFSNHNGGMLAFGPDDGYLYIGLGDGGSAGDPGDRAQDGQELLGKLLRIDVDGPAPYGIPADNPFVGDPAFRDEIWAYGLRNPWRFSFDAATFDLYIGDVGQNLIEEIDFEPATSTGGVNYGWNIMEGDECFEPPSGCNMTGLTLPVFTYTHAEGCSVTGGYTYRGCGIPDLQGTYFFADYCSGTIWTFRIVDGEVTDLMDRTTELVPSTGGTLSEIVSFAEDGYGEMYIVTQFAGDVFKIVPDLQGFGDCNANGAPDGCDIDSGTSADCNGDLLPDECLDPFDVSPGPIFGGVSHTFTTTCGTPNETVFFAGSASGPGSTPTPFGPLDLSDARPLGSAGADANGEASLTIQVPETLSGRTIGWQAIETNGRTTDVEVDTVQ